MSQFAPSASDWAYLAVGAALGYGVPRVWRALTSRAPLLTGSPVIKAGPGGLAPGAGSDLLPSDIITAIGQCPPVQQDRAARSYHGVDIRWRVTLESAFTSGLTTERLMCQDRGNFPWVICDVRRGKYPQLAALPPHAPFWISGRITSIQGDQIFLRGVRLSFEE